MLSVSEQLDGEEMWLFTELGMSQADMKDKHRDSS